MVTWGHCTKKELDGKQTTRKRPEDGADEEARADEEAKADKESKPAKEDAREEQKSEATALLYQKILLLKSVWVRTFGNILRSVILIRRVTIASR